MVMENKNRIYTVVAFKGIATFLRDQLYVSNDGAP